MKDPDIIKKHVQCQQYVLLHVNYSKFGSGHISDTTAI